MLPNLYSEGMVQRGSPKLSTVQLIIHSQTSIQAKKLHMGASKVMCSISLSNPDPSKSPIFTFGITSKGWNHMVLTFSG